MQNRVSYYQNLAGVGTGVTVVIISSLLLWGSAIFWESLAWQMLILLALVILAGAAHLALKRDAAIGQTGIDKFAFWVIVPLVFALSWRVSADVYFIYTIIWMAYAPYYMSWKKCWWWLVILNMGWYLVRLYAWEESQALAGTLLVTTFHAFALLSAATAQEAQLANEKTQELNRELLATQHLLSETSKETERTRIARNLHDLLGHHLTALTINLQVAGRLTEGEAREKIVQCHDHSKLLLGDVREAVATLREMPLVNLKELLEIAIQDIPRLQIKLDIEEGLSVDNVDTAEVLLRIVQEAITNTLKHSKAHSAEVNIVKQDDEIVLNYSDDGGGCEQPPVHGNGLKGMQERIEQLKGRLEVESKPTFSIRTFVPLAS